MRITPHRTTIALDADVYPRVKQFCRKREIPFRQGLNELIRTGLLHQKGASLAEYPIQPFDLGTLPGVDFNCTSRLLEYLEGPYWK